MAAKKKSKPSQKYADKVVIKGETFTGVLKVLAKSADAKTMTIKKGKSKL